MKRYKFTKKDLNRLYWGLGLTTGQIGKRLGCCQATVQKRMCELKIPLRPSGMERIKIPKEDLKELYVDRCLSSRKIGKIYNCAYSAVDRKIRQYGFPIKSLAAAHITTHRAPFDGNSIEKAYLIGFRTGDLRVRKMYKNSETILADCGSTRYDQIQLIESLFRKYGRVWISKPNKRGVWQIECSLNNSFEFLLKKYKTFPRWITEKHDLFLSALAGFIDADGSFAIAKSEKQAFFALGNYNISLLNQIKKQIDNLGFHNRLFLGKKIGFKDKNGYISNGDYWTLSIYRKRDVCGFTQKILPFLQYSRKINDAEKVINNINERNRKYGFINMKT